MGSVDMYSAAWFERERQLEDSVFNLKQQHKISYAQLVKEFPNLSASDLGRMYRKALKRRVLELRRGGMSHEEIAEQLNTHLDRVKIISFPSDLAYERHVEKYPPRRYPGFSWLPALVGIRREIEHLLENMNERAGGLRNAVHAGGESDERPTQRDACSGL